MSGFIIEAVPLLVSLKPMSMLVLPSSLMLCNCIGITKKISFQDLLTATASSIVVKKLVRSLIRASDFLCFYSNSRRLICAIIMAFLLFNYKHTSSIYNISEFWNRVNILNFIIKIEYSTLVPFLFIIKWINKSNLIFQ